MPCVTLKNWRMGPNLEMVSRKIMSSGTYALVDTDARMKETEGNGI